MAEVEKVLLSFLHGEIATEDLLDSLRDHVRYSPRKSRKVVRYQSGLGTEIEVGPEDLRPMLLRYLRGEVNGQELSKWAFLILTLDAYTSPNWEDDVLADRYEAMWYVLQQLSTPEIDGVIAPEQVREHLEVLSRLQAVRPFQTRG